jgi:hypothetical protein
MDEFSPQHIHYKEKKKKKNLLYALFLNPLVVQELFLVGHVLVNLQSFEWRLILIIVQL